MMTKTYICDRCGNKKEAFHGVDISTRTKVIKDVNWITLRSKSGYKKELDLCEVCLNSFKNWFNDHDINDSIS